MFSVRHGYFLGIRTKNAMTYIHDGISTASLTISMRLKPFIPINAQSVVFAGSISCPKGRKTIGLGPYRQEENLRKVTRH